MEKLNLNNPNPNKLSFWLATALWGLLVLVVSVLGKSVIDNEQRSVDRHELLLEKIGSLNTKVTVIEKNHITEKDLSKLWDKIGDHYPPPELKRTIRNLEDDYKSLEDECKILERQLDKLELKVLNIHDHKRKK